MEELERPCCIRGYHVYKNVWAASIGEVLMCEREPHNALDQYGRPSFGLKKLRIDITTFALHVESFSLSDTCTITRVFFRSVNFRC